jgi:hypothetical protein
VTPDLTDPERRMAWEIDGGSSFVSQNERIAHFGLGTLSDPVDMVSIEWPSGLVQRLFNVSVDQTLVVVEADEPASGDFDGDQDVDAADMGNWQAGFGLSVGAIHSQGNADGDSDVDGVDFLTWQLQWGSPAATAAASEVAEPSSSALLLLSCAAIAALARSAPGARRIAGRTA